MGSFFRRSYGIATIRTSMQIITISVMVFRRILKRVEQRGLDQNLRGEIYDSVPERRVIGGLYPPDRHGPEEIAL